MLLPLLSAESDLFRILLACTQHSLSAPTSPSSCALVKWTEGAVACTVVAAAKGYPSSYEKGTPVSFSPLPAVGELERLSVFHAGTGGYRTHSPIVC